MRLVVALLAIASCTDGSRLVVEGFVQSECADDPDTDAPEEALLLVGGDGQITVAHRAYPANCCVTLEPVATAIDATITVVYEEDGDLCDCMCIYDLGYTIVELAEGSWTVTANRESALVQVD